MEAPEGGGPTPFVDLPAALVEEVLERTADVADHLLESFRQVREERAMLRRQLEDKGLVTRESDLECPPAPTTCATDGSYALERLLTTDLAAAAAVAVEGLTPPSEKRHWPLPQHEVFVAAEPHLEDTATVLRAVMLGEELRLAERAPHDVVMFDGTLTLPTIYFNQALNRAPGARELHCAQAFLDRCTGYLRAYLTLLRAERSDRQHLALPKYSTRREIGTRVGWPATHDDRGLLTLVLEPGELTRPVPLEHPRDREGNVTWHLAAERVPAERREEASALADEIVSALEGVHVFYYRPHGWLPALRVEVAGAIARNAHRLSVVVQALRHQCATPSMLEPYPVYLADRMAKALARAVPAFRQVATQHVSERYDGDIGEVFFAMHGYRSESGR